MQAVIQSIQENMDDCIMKNINKLKSLSIIRLMYQVESDVISWLMFRDFFI